MRERRDSQTDLSRHRRHDIRSVRAQVSRPTRILQPQARDVTKAALMDEWKFDDRIVTRTSSLAFDLLLR